MSDKNFIKRKDRKGAVTLIKRGGAYDDAYGDDTIDGISGSSAAETIKSQKDKKALSPERSSKVMRRMSSERRQENARKGQNADFKFFKHTTKGK